MIVYLLCMMIIFWIGSEKFGGFNIIKYGWDMGFIVIVVFFFYVWVFKSGYKIEYLKEVINVNNEMKVVEV